MKQFIVKNIVFALALFLLAFLLDALISSGLKRNRSVLFKTLTKVYQGEINADLIINGSSKALVQIDPNIIDSVLGTHSYNLGLDAMPFTPQKALFELYSKSNTKPKILIQVVSNGALRSAYKGFGNPVKFAPYLDIPTVERHMKLTSGFAYWDYKIPLFKYSGSPFEAVIGILSFANINLFESQDRRGYMPSNKAYNDKNEKKKLSRVAAKIKRGKPFKLKEWVCLDSTSCGLFEEFLASCKSNNIVVFMVYPPIYSKYSITVKNIAYYGEVADKYNAYFLNYSRDSSLVYRQGNFCDSQHLNEKGASLFTKKLAEDIKGRMAERNNK